MLTSSHAKLLGPTTAKGIRNKHKRDAVQMSLKAFVRTLSAELQSAWNAAKKAPAKKPTKGIGHTNRGVKHAKQQKSGGSK